MAASNFASRSASGLTSAVTKGCAERCALSGAAASVLVTDEFKTAPPAFVTAYENKGVKRVQFITRARRVTRAAARKNGARAAVFPLPRRPRVGHHWRRYSFSRASTVMRPAPR
jgi:hypothetical protein